jgi:hypothetical protein
MITSMSSRTFFFDDENVVFRERSEPVDFARDFSGIDVQFVRKKISNRSSIIGKLRGIRFEGLQKRRFLCAG